MATPAHLNALRAFEASARHASFSAAARELNVTPAAVGQLVKTLEDWLGTPLFHRASSGKARLILTARAERALPDIRAGLDSLATGVQILRETDERQVLTVTVSPAFAAKWLLPRIERFHHAWPELDLRLDTQHRPLDLAAHGIDAGIRYGAGHWPGLLATRLMEEEVYPVCAPALLENGGPLNHPNDLAGKVFIHDLSMQGHRDFPTWQAWLTKAGVPQVNNGRGMQINNSAAILQAAIDGHGIALARSVMVHDDIKAGRLVRLFPSLRYASPLAYHVVCRPECAELPRFTAFRDWLLEEVSS